LFLQRGVVLSKIPDFHGQFKKNSGEWNFTVNFKDFFPKGGCSHPPDPPAYAYVIFPTNSAKGPALFMYLHLYGYDFERLFLQKR
jgi:hypothetical protein